MTTARGWHRTMLYSEKSTRIDNIEKARDKERESSGRDALTTIEKGLTIVCEYVIDLTIM